ncbi:MAG: efflux RND transporter periplasmic adaptor subunit [Candidatus Marinimicrobia bacterium]|nr:efflux RND transporter periplasmic adaptor subunit [Candidatus Neomarinimicrobiota bacterium]
MRKSKKLKKFLITIIVVIVVGGAGFYFFTKGPGDLGYDFAFAEKGGVVQEVSVTGRVQPSKSVDLAFEKTGKISRIYVDVGDRVYQGQTLIQYDNSDIKAQLDGAQANLKTQQAKLDELLVGTRKEEIQIKEIGVLNAETVVDDANQDLFNKMVDSFTKADDAVRNKVDQLFSNPRSDNPKLDFVYTDVSFKTSVENERVYIENLLSLWQESVSLLFASDDLINSSGSFRSNLNTVKLFLDKMALMVNSLTDTSTLSQTTIDGWKADISTARTNLNTAIVNLSSAEEGVRTAVSALSLAEKNLELANAGSTAEQIAAQEAQVEKASADIKNYEAQLSKTVLWSPIKGVVTKSDVNVGEIVSANTVVISIISDSNFEIEADIPEVDVAKLEVGDTALVTLDAYGDEVPFKAIIVSIDPAETLVEGVPSYKTTFQFAEGDSRIRSGMTANMDIITQEKNDVIVIPQRAVISKDGSKYVRVVDPMSESGEFVEVEVKTGLRGSFGNVEIIEGVNVGDKVVTFVKK